MLDGLGGFLDMATITIGALCGLVFILVVIRHRLEKRRPSAAKPEQQWLLRRHEDLGPAQPKRKSTSLHKL